MNTRYTYKIIKNVCLFDFNLRNIAVGTGLKMLNV